MDTCPDCDGPIDADGDTTEDPTGCVTGGEVSHETDCDICGAVWCDMSC